jgi:hypothetical protein
MEVKFGIEPGAGRAEELLKQCGPRGSRLLGAVLPQRTGLLHCVADEGYEPGRQAAEDVRVLGDTGELVDVEADEFGGRAVLGHLGF